MVEAALQAQSERACPICGDRRSWPLEQYQDPLVARVRKARGDQRPYFWRLCRTCGNGYPTYQPDHAILEELWKRNRVDESETADQEAAAWRYRQEVSRKGAKRSWAVFSPLFEARPGRLLDIACGLGETVRIFADHGWDAYGIDTDPSVLPFHRALGIRSEIGQIERATITGRFDMIHISHAVYFIADPRGFLESLRAKLTDDGWLCLVLADFMSADDLGLPNFHHSFFPTGASMRYLLALAGYRIYLSRRISGSIYLAARAMPASLPSVHPWLIRFGYGTKRLRYAIFGRLKLWLHRVAKHVLGKVLR